MGKLPRIPKSSWESKRRGPEKFKLDVSTWKDGKLIKEPPREIEMDAGLYLEDILVWCSCKEETDAEFIEEPDGTHGTVCTICGGVKCLG